MDGVIILTLVFILQFHAIWKKHWKKDDHVHHYDKLLSAKSMDPAMVGFT